MPYSIEPVPRVRHGWTSEHKHFVNICANSTSEILITGASIVKGLSRYQRTWNEYLGELGAVNLGIGGDRAENVLWRVINGEVPRHIKCAIIMCGTNNIDSNRPQAIADSIVDIGMAIRTARPETAIFLHGLLPRDACPQSYRRVQIEQVNDMLEGLCGWKGMTFLKPSSDFCEMDGRLSRVRYRTDNLHLLESGNVTLARDIFSAVRRQQEHADKFIDFFDDDVIGLPEYLGNGWDGTLSSPSYAMGEFESIGATPSHPLPPTSSPPGDGFPPLLHPPLTSRISPSHATSPWGRVSVPRISCPSAFPPLPPPLPPLAWCSRACWHRCHSCCCPCRCSYHRTCHRAN